MHFFIVLFDITIFLVKFVIHFAYLHVSLDILDAHLRFLLFIFDNVFICSDVINMVTSIAPLTGFFHILDGSQVLIIFRLFYHTTNAYVYDHKYLIMLYISLALILYLLFLP